MVYFPRVVLAEEDAAPCGLDCINVVPGVRIDEVDAVVHGEVRETVSVEIAVRTPAVTDDHCAWFDPVMYDDHQCVGGCPVQEQEMFYRTLIQHRQTPTDP
jgi:hypothetical protein